MAPESLQDTLSVWLKFDIRINKDNKADVKVKKGVLLLLPILRALLFLLQSRLFTVNLSLIQLRGINLIRIIR